MNITEFRFWFLTRGESVHQWWSETHFSRIPIAEAAALVSVVAAWLFEFSLPDISLRCLNDVIVGDTQVHGSGPDSVISESWGGASSEPINDTSWSAIRALQNCTPALPPAFAQRPSLWLSGLLTPGDGFEHTQVLAVCFWKNRNIHLTG